MEKTYREAQRGGTKGEGEIFLVPQWSLVTLTRVALGRVRRG